MKERLEYMCNITVIGSSNMDLVVRSEQIPKIGETVLGKEFFMVPGGKGANQAVAAARLGAQVHFCTCIGDDIFGKEIIKNLKEANINTQFLNIRKDIPTGVAVIMVDDEANNIISVAPGANATLTIDDARKTLTATKCEIILLQLETPLPVITFCAEFGFENNIPVILNPAPAQKLASDLLSKINILTPNATEASLLSGIDVRDIDSAIQAANILRTKGVKTVIITLGGNGALLSSENHIEHIEAKKVKAIDTTAAGDAFNGALAVSIARGDDILSSIEFANKVAAISITRKGAQSSLPSLAEINSFEN